MRVGVFTVEEAAAFLRERTGLDDAGGAHELAEEVGRLPLALGQAAAVLSAQHLSFRTVAQRLREMPLDRFLVRDLAEAYPHGVAQAVLLAMDAVERADPLAGALARLIAVLSPAGTSRDVLRGYHELDEQLGDATVADIDAAVGHLAEASLITFSVDDEAVLMHRLTQRVLRDAENHRGGLDEQVLIAGKLIRACLPDYQDRWARRALGRHLILHIDALWDLVAQDANRNGEVREAARKILSLRNWSVSYLWTIQDPERAIERGVPIAADHERLLGSDCRETVDAWYGLALAYGMQRRHDEAIALNQKVVDWYAAHDGVAAHSTSVMRNTFGNNFIESADDFRQPSRLSTAVAIHEQNFALSEQHLGIDHRETRRSGLNLARAYLDIGRSAEARALAARMKELCMLAATPGDDVTLQSYEVLARTLAADGALGEALAEIDEGISVSIAMRGDDHPATWRVRKTRAEFLQQAGHIDVALGELEQVVAAYTRLLGSNSPATSKTLESLADAYVNAGRTAQAAAIYEKAMQACVQSVGDDSPITRRIAAKVAGLETPSGCSSRRTRRRTRATTGSGAGTR